MVNEEGAARSNIQAGFVLRRAPGPPNVWQPAKLTGRSRLSAIAESILVTFAELSETMRHLHLILVASCFGAIAETAPLAAQRVPAEAVSPAVDTSPWGPLLQGLVETLAPLITQAATDTTTRPWTITLPDTTSDWKHVAAHLAATLRARAPMPTDSMYFELEVSALRVRGDTASARMRWRMRRKCSDGRYHGGYENMMEPFVVRTVWLGAPVWSAARKGSIRHGDSICGN